MSIIRRLRRRSDQAGLTLVEMIIAVFVLGVVGAISIAAFLSGGQTYGRTDDDVRGQQDIKAITERLSRDLRAARGVAAGATDHNLSIWIDYDANYQQGSAETVTWDVAANPSSPGHYDVRRTVSGSTPVVIGSSVIDATTFRYFAKAGDTTTLTGSDVTQAGVVEVTLKYDAILGAYLGQKLNIYQVRLRNAE